MTTPVIQAVQFEAPPSSTVSERFWAKVDVGGNDECWLWTAAVNHNGYGVLMIRKRPHRNVLAHRYAYEERYGRLPEGKMVDHRLHCSTRCVNPDHLRAVTHKQNQENRRGAQSNSISGVRGVTRNRRGWRARVRHNGVRHDFGTYPTVAEAEKAAIDGRMSLFTHNEKDRAA